MKQILSQTSVHDPKMNYYQIYKQLLLIEDHLTNTHMRCKFCVHKHISTVLALNDELRQLDTHGIYRLMIDGVQKDLGWIPKEVRKNKLNDVLQAVRKVRRIISRQILFKMGIK